MKVCLSVCVASDPLRSASPPDSHLLCPPSFLLHPQPFPGPLPLSLDGFRLFVWWCWWLVWRLCCLVSPLIRVDVAPARPIGAERLRLTAGHLSRAISVGAEAHPPLVGPAYREDQRQSARSALCTLSAAPFTSASDTHSFVSRLCLLPLSPPWCASAALRLMAGIWQYVFWLFSSCFPVK